MAIKVKVQKDYLKTESTVELPAKISEIDELLRETKTNGKMIVLYNEGFVQGVNIEQNTKLSETKSEKVRSLLKIKDEEL